MRVRWSREALADLRRLHAFLAPVSPLAADGAISSILEAPDRLIDHPRLGERVDRYVDRDVRRLFVDDYELHYEVARETIFIIRVWHMREDR
ncbi:MAG: type II toxin-antitoxin system RelE/ParE family toxin [Caulobacter sp.]|nr:type II toxin-antitoxin system RelE/ParE family toxin [Caulobacter sp.]